MQLMHMAAQDGIRTHFLKRRGNLCGSRQGRATVAIRSRHKMMMRHHDAQIIRGGRGSEGPTRKGELWLP
ncbi:MAG: hypothetical protein ACKVIN_12395, partial [Longimicrobiales bacterium]